MKAADLTTFAPTPENWPELRADIVRRMESVMGPFPGRDTTPRPPPEFVVESETDHGTHIVRRISYSTEPGSRTPAYLCLPKAALHNDTRSFPAVLCLHPTNFEIGAGVVVGLGGRANRQYAAELAARGYVTLAPNYPLLADYAPDLAGLGCVSGTMKAVRDNVRALDLLAALPCVRAEKFGAIGHSLGGHNAVFTAVFEPRLAAVVSSCGLDSFRDYMGGDPAVWQPGAGWCSERYMPRLAAYAGRLHDIPFDFHEILAALAPRPVLISAPLHDDNFQWRSVDRVVAAAQRAYDLHGATDRLRVIHPDCDHDFPAAAREEAYRLFDAVLN